MDFPFLLLYIKVYISAIPLKNEKEHKLTPSYSAN